MSDEGPFIAGLIEAEGTFAITELNGGQSLGCGCRVALRDDDLPLLAWVRETTGIGSIYAAPARGRSRPQVFWDVRKRSECAELACWLCEHPMLGRKDAEFAIWDRAVTAWRDSGPARRDELRHLRRELVDIRRYRPPLDWLPPIPTDVTGHLSGYLCGEGHFSIAKTTNQACMVVHIRADDRPLLELYARETGLGKVSRIREYAGASPTVTWTVAAKDEIDALLAHLEEHPLRGRKQRDVDALRLARSGDWDAARQAIQVARTYRAPTLELPVTPRIDQRARAVATLRTWAAEHEGSLSATAYQRARQPGWPTRNSIAKACGSWHEALEAAGLADRGASRPARWKSRKPPKDSEAKRIQTRTAILASVRRCAGELGREPRAMEYFGWRLAHDASSPTQGTVYNHFDGWSDVLAGLRGG